MEWTEQKPDFACIFLTRDKYQDKFEYSLWEFAWEHGEPTKAELKALKEGEEETRFYYLSWCDYNGEEQGDISECNFEEYLVLENLPTMDEVHKKWRESMKNS